MLNRKQNTFAILTRSHWTTPSTEVHVGAFITASQIHGVAKCRRRLSLATCVAKACCNPQSWTQTGNSSCDLKINI